MISRALRLLAPLLLSGLLDPASVGAGSLTAVITQVEKGGESVQLQEAASRSILPPKPWQIVRAGARFVVPKGARLGIVCSTEYFVRIEGPASWDLDEKACARGRHLARVDYELIVPQGGRLKVVPGLLGLAQGMRGNEDDPVAPTILGPRNTALRALRPSISWVRISSAVEYKIEWSGRGQASFELRLDAEDAHCAIGWESLEICSIPWPADRLDLSPGQTFFLKMSARDGIVAPWHESPAVEIHTLEPCETAKLEAKLHDLEALGLTGSTLEAARAGLLARNQLLADAAEIYRNLVASSPTAELEVTLADTYLRIGLLRIAASYYSKVSTNESPAVRAASAFGLGQIEYSSDRYAEAKARFLEAERLYTSEGLKEEEAAAHRGATKAEARIRK
jgi:hypothetical protein